MSSSSPRPGAPSHSARGRRPRARRRRLRRPRTSRRSPNVPGREARTRASPPRRLPAPRRPSRVRRPRSEGARRARSMASRARSARRRCDLPASLSPTRRPVQGTHASARQPLRARPRRLRRSTKRSTRRAGGRAAVDGDRDVKSRARWSAERLPPRPIRRPASARASRCSTSNAADETDGSRGVLGSISVSPATIEQGQPTPTARPRSAAAHDLVSYYEDKYGDGGQGRLAEAGDGRRCRRRSKNTSESSARQGGDAWRAVPVRSACGEIGHNGAPQVEAPAASAASTPSGDSRATGARHVHAFVVRRDGPRQSNVSNRRRRTSTVEDPRRRV